MHRKLLSSVFILSDIYHYRIGNTRANLCLLIIVRNETIDNIMHLHTHTDTIHIKNSALLNKFFNNKLLKTYLAAIIIFKYFSVLYEIM